MLRTLGPVGLAGLAAVLGAVAGLMAEPSQLFLVPTFMQPILVYAFAAAALGGLESPAGAIVGGLAIGVSPDADRSATSPQIGSELQLPFAFALILAVLLVKPTASSAAGRCSAYEAETSRARARSPSSRRSSCVLPFVLSDYNVYLAARGRDLLHRGARPQHPHRLHRPDLDRPRRVHGDRRLHDGRHVARPPHESRRDDARRLRDLLRRRPARGAAGAAALGRLPRARDLRPRGLGAPAAAEVVEVPRRQRVGVADSRRSDGQQPLALRRRLGCRRDPLRARVADPARTRRPRVPRRPRQRDRGGRVRESRCGSTRRSPSGSPPPSAGSPGRCSSWRRTALRSPTSSPSSSRSQLLDRRGRRRPRLALG